MSVPTQRVESVRRFNRLYTKRLGLLNKGYLDSSLTLSEARLLFELGQGSVSTAVELSKILALDAGNVSRLVRSLTQRGLLACRAAKTDGRQKHLLTTTKGRKVYAALNRRSNEEVSRMLRELPERGQVQFVEAAATIEKLLRPRSEAKVPYVLRPHQPGDMGWVIHRHGVIYSQEYGWDERFEALVAEIAAKFIQEFNPKRERCWIADRDGAIVGSVFLVEKSAQVAKLRLLLVEPSARGLGIGSRLVEECVRFARQAGYKKITLWTQSVLAAARHIYQKAGFQLDQEERHAIFGYDLIGQTWELKL